MVTEAQVIISILFKGNYGRGKFTHQEVFCRATHINCGDLHVIKKLAIGVFNSNVLQ